MDEQHKTPTAQEQWDCAKLVLLSHFTVELPQIWFVPSCATSQIDLLTALGSSIQWHSILDSRPEYPSLLS